MDYGNIKQIRVVRGRKGERRGNNRIISDDCTNKVSKLNRFAHKPSRPSKRNTLGY